MTAYDLPTSLLVGGVERPIRTGWRVVMDIFAMYNDPDFDNEMKTVGLIKILYPNWREISAEDMPEAIQKACEFLDCGFVRDDVNRPKIVDWVQDAPLIIPAVNGVAGLDVRNDPNIHWWTFWGWYMDIESGLFSTVLQIRKKKAYIKKLTDAEKEFYNENKQLVVMKSEIMERQKALEEIEKWLGG